MNREGGNIVNKSFSSVFILGVLLLSVIFFSFLRLLDYGYGADSAGMLEQIHILKESGIYTSTHFPPGFGLLAYPFLFVV